MTESKPLLGGVELGGTKCVCLIGTGPEDIRVQISVPTGSDAQATLSRIEEILRNGMSSVRTHSRARHCLVRAARSGAALPDLRCHHLDRKARLAPYAGAPRGSREAFDVPVGFDTDVNGAALAEGRWGAAEGLEPITPTSPSAPASASAWSSSGRLAHGFGHPELGHIRIVRKAGDLWPGACSFHGDCVEGLASGVAIAARAG